MPKLHNTCETAVNKGNISIKLLLREVNILLIFCGVNPKNIKKLQKKAFSFAPFQSQYRGVD